jgi:hypothetical protein
MIDTLKLARRLESANLPKEQAEALAEGLNESLKENYVTNERFDLGLSKLKTELVFWMVGTVGLGVLINHFWR